jgi:hypothetical protein
MDLLDNGDGQAQYTLRMPSTNALDHLPARNGPSIGSRGRQPPGGRSLERCAPKEPPVFATATDTPISQLTQRHSFRCMVPVGQA